MQLQACFIGLGNMGSPMAKNLLSHGVQLFVHNRTKIKATELVQFGATLLEHPGKAFEKAKIVFTMVSNDQALIDIVEGENGLLHNAHPGCIHVSMSTISPELSLRLTKTHIAKGVHYITAPVFGRPRAVAEQKLWICMAGNSHAKHEVTPLLQLLGQKISDFGDNPAAANYVKLAGNFMILSSVELIAETYTFLQKSGVSLENFQSFIEESMFACPIFQIYGRLIMHKEFTPAGFKLPLGLKDINMFLDEADKLHVPSPLANIVHDRLLVAIAHMRDNLDWSSIALSSMEDAGLS